MYRGKSVLLTWDENGDHIGDRNALDHLAELAAERVDDELVLGTGERVRGNLMAHPVGFVYLCGLLLSDFSTDYEPPELPAGYVT